MKIFVDSGDLDALGGALARTVSERAPGAQRTPDPVQRGAQTLACARPTHMGAFYRSRAALRGSKS